MKVEQLRQRIGMAVERMESQGDNRAASFAEAVPVNASTLLALLDIAEAADVLSGHARHEKNCDRTLALLAGRGLSQGGPGAPCNCGFKDALASYQAALSRLDTED